MYHITHPSMKLHMDTSIANTDLYDVLNYSLYKQTYGIRTTDIQ